MYWWWEWNGDNQFIMRDDKSLPLKILIMILKDKHMEENCTLFLQGRAMTQLRTLFTYKFCMQKVPGISEKNSARNSGELLRRDIELGRPAAQLSIENRGKLYKKCLPPITSTFVSCPWMLQRPNRNWLSVCLVLQLSKNVKQERTFTARYL